MKITAIDNTKLRNEEHYQFQTDFKGLVEKNTPAALGIAVQFTAYLPLYDNEGEALNVIRRSAVTDDLSDADILRDSTFRGVTDAVKAALEAYVQSEQQSMEHYLEDQYLVAKAATVTVAPTGEVVLVCAEDHDTILSNIEKALAA